MGPLASGPPNFGTPVNCGPSLSEILDPCPTKYLQGRTHTVF